VERLVHDRVLDAAKRCCERWGVQKVTIDDIVAESGVSRATIYRLFPGGRDVLYEALRLRETEEFFSGLQDEIRGATTFEQVVVRGVVAATRALRADEAFKLMLASEPGTVAARLTVEGLPRILRVGTAHLSPWFAPYIGKDQSARLAEWLSRVVISYFLAPSRFVDLADETSATAFVRAFVLPAFAPSAPPTLEPVPEGR
jgi:AcrR family transcriptional regulator